VEVQELVLGLIHHSPEYLVVLAVAVEVRALMVLVVMEINKQAQAPLNPIKDIPVVLVVIMFLRDLVEAVVLVAVDLITVVKAVVLVVLEKEPQSLDQVMGLELLDQDQQLVDG
tara:strand:+ start:465 stop:806 length:342 start_codon:yes stop_codon:yes gene_type:complete